MKLMRLKKGGEIRTPYLTVSEAARYCRMDRNTFVREADAARVPFIPKPCNRRIYAVHDLDEWMKQKASS
jgi:hypothetical protein